MIISFRLQYNVENKKRTKTVPKTPRSHPIEFVFFSLLFKQPLIIYTLIHFPVTVKHALDSMKTLYSASSYYSGFRHVMMANLIRFFLYPFIINGIAKAPFMALSPGPKSIKLKQSGRQEVPSPGQK